MKNRICVIILLLCMIMCLGACDKKVSKSQNKKQEENSWIVNEIITDESNSEPDNNDIYMNGGGSITAYTQEGSDITDRQIYVRMSEPKKYELNGICKIKLEYSLGYSKEDPNDFLQKNTSAYIGMYVNNQPVTMKIDGEIYDGLKLVECEPFKEYSIECEVDFSKYQKGVVSVAFIPLPKEGDVFEHELYETQVIDIGVVTVGVGTSELDTEKVDILTKEEVTNKFGKELKVNPVHFEKALDGNYYCVIHTSYFSGMEDRDITKFYAYVIDGNNYAACINSTIGFECDMKDYEFDEDRCYIVKKIDTKGLKTGDEIRMFVTSELKDEYEDEYLHNDSAVSLLKIYEE